MNAIVKDVMTTPVVAVRLRRYRVSHVPGVVAVRNRFSDPGMSPSASRSN